MNYNLIVIGTGPAGLSASIYASRYHLSNLVIGKIFGGTITYAHEVDNFPGLMAVSGVELGQKMIEQAKTLGAEVLLDGVKEINMTKDGNSQSFKLVTESGKEFETKALVVATGTERRKLNVPGEKEYLGKGVSYCTNCDAPFFKDKTVVLVGGANAACSGAAHVAEFAKKVYLIYRQSELRAEPAWVEEVKSNPLIEVIYNTNVIEILGDGIKVTKVKLDKAYNGSEELLTDGLFVEIGGIPLSSLLKQLSVETDENNYIKVNEYMETNVPGIFAAGDLTDKSQVLQQTVTACAQGAIAASSAYKFIKKGNK